MTLPVRSVMQEGGSLFERAQEALKDASRALKRLAHMTTTEEDAELPQAVDILRNRVKKAGKRAQVLRVKWTEKATQWSERRRAPLDRSFGLTEDGHDGSQGKGKRLREGSRRRGFGRR